MNWEYIWECMKIQIIGELGWTIVVWLTLPLLSFITVRAIKLFKKEEDERKDENTQP